MLMGGIVISASLETMPPMQEVLDLSIKDGWAVGMGQSLHSTCQQPASFKPHKFPVAMVAGIRRIIHSGRGRGWPVSGSLLLDATRVPLCASETGASRQLTQAHRAAVCQHRGSNQYRHQFRGEFPTGSVNHVSSAKAL